jgi:hypothetical protein
LVDLLKKETFDYFSKLNLLIKLIKQLQKIHRMGFFLLNIKPTNIMVERVNEKNKKTINLHFSRFNKCCLSKTGRFTQNKYPDFMYMEQDSLVPPVQLFESNTAKPYKFESQNNSPS